jgi:cytochrome c oxidase assembly protein subunit 15
MSGKLARGAAIAPAQGAPGAGALPATRAPAGDPARALARWLLACALCVVLVLVVGGITRLTHAGLAIVQWQPLVGTLPPLNDAQWQAAFDQYRATPEFRLIFPDMALGEFRRIFWWEYAHRLLARLTGVVFLLPFLWFLATRRLPRLLAVRLAAIFALGGLQGALGWLMVASGLVDEPHVSPVRLCAHLGLALLLLALLLWQAGSLWFEGLPHGGARSRSADWRDRAAVWLVPALVWVMALSGGLMAGTRAGYAYDTFPTLNGELLPSGLLQGSPWYRNLLDNPATIQFLHRSLAGLVVAAILVQAWQLRGTRSWRLPAAPPIAVAARAARQRLRVAVRLMLCALSVQASLGIATVVSGVPLPLAALHQAGAVALFASTIWVALLWRRRTDLTLEAKAVQARARTSTNAAHISSER